MPRRAETGISRLTKNLDPPFTIHPIFEHPNGFVIITTSEAGPLGSARRAMKRDIWTPSSNTLNEALLRHWLCKLQSSYRHVNRQIHSEALNVFQQNNFIRICTLASFKQDVIRQGKFSLIAEREKALQCENWHSMVVLDHAGPLNAEPFYDFISCLEDLPFFCKV